MNNASAASAWTRQVEEGTTRRPSDTAHTSRWREGRGPRRAAEGRAVWASKRRTSLKGSTHNATRVAPSQETAWTSSARSACDRRQNLRIDPIALGVEDNVRRAGGSVTSWRRGLCSPQAASSLPPHFALVPVV